MSMIERLLYWIGIVVLLAAVYGMSQQISHLEELASVKSAAQQGGNQQ